MFKKIKLYLKNKKVIHSFKSLLVSGFYVIDPKKKTFVRTNFLASIFPFFKFKIVTHVFGRGCIKNGKYAFGDSKSVLFAEKQAFVKYKNRSDFVSFLSKIDMLPLLPYSFPEVKYFNYKDKIVVENIASGINPHNSLDSIKELIEAYKKCFKQVPSASLTIHNNNCKAQLIYIFQHGDFGHNNIFINSEKLMVVDLDSLNIYPLFFDLFYFLFLKCEWAISKSLLNTDFVFKTCKTIAGEYNFVLTTDLYLTYLEDFIYNVTSEKNIYNRFVFANELFEKVNSLDFLKNTPSFRRIKAFLVGLVQRRTSKFEPIRKKDLYD